MDYCYSSEITGSAQFQHAALYHYESIYEKLSIFFYGIFDERLEARKALVIYWHPNESILSLDLHQFTLQYHVIAPCFRHEQHTCLRHRFAMITS